ncbi:MAG TPA: hypothetical protein VFY78_08425, partial [Gammaproteobacteria bacterium]|nr:hypothetical protein [Gammaproteobacteria bacterium]
MINLSKIRSRYSYIAIALLLLVAIASLLWVYRLRLAEFHSYHHNFATGASGEVSNQFSFLLHERQRQVALFAEDHQPLLEQLVHDPENTDLHDQVNRRLLRSFPDYFAFVLTTPQGDPYWADFDGYIGDICVQDIQKFANTNINRVRIHPNPIEYHYDVMARWTTNKKQERILMVSFKPDQLVQTLRTVKVPGHSLVLLQTEIANLIEITDQGSRTTLKRDDFHLTDDELSRIVHRQDIPDSRWQLVDMFEAGFVEKYRRELFTDMALFLVAFLGVAAASTLLIRREEQARQRAETAREEMIATVTHELRTPLTS